VIGAIILASRVMVAIAVRSLAGNPDDVTLRSTGPWSSSPSEDHADWPIWPRPCV